MYGASNQGFAFFTFRICDGCGKEFKMYEGHVYKDIYKNKSRVFCCWTCFNNRTIFEDGRKHPRKASEEVMGNQTKYDNPYALCPFYKGECKNEIFCEGLFEKSKLHFAISPPSKKVRYRRRYCEKDYGRCPIAKMHFAINQGKEEDCGEI